MRQHAPTSLASPGEEPEHHLGQQGLFAGRLGPAACHSAGKHKEQGRDPKPDPNQKLLAFRFFNDLMVSALHRALPPARRRVHG